MRYGLIGEKLGHSFSKEIHETLADYEYELCALNKTAFHEFMQARDFQAINVTIPYKKDVIPYLDEIDDKAKAIGAVNTIVHENDKLKGFNTDYDGFFYMLKKHHIHLKEKKVLILGNGGASAAVQAVVKDEQASEMIVVSPSASNGAISFAEVYAKHRDAEIIINTSPIGMYPNADASPIQLADFPNCEVVVDIIYNPLITALGIQAKKANLLFVGGLEMLVAQAVYAVNHFLHKDFEVEVIDEIYRKLLHEKMNLVLIGMPSAGKTSIAKELAKQLNMKFLDSDDEIVKTYHQSIPEIFAKEKEVGFRQKEEAILKQLASQNHCVIATGGGAILKEVNVDTLAQNGILIYIHRNIDQLLCDDSRPLSKDKNTLQEMYEYRYPLYQRSAFTTVENNSTITQCVETIIEHLTTWINDYFG